MLLFLVFAFLAGIVTILSPCILPLLPVILSSATSKGTVSKQKPLGVVSGFIGSFTVSTLFLSILVRHLGIPPDALRSLAIGTLLLFGAFQLIPSLEHWVEFLFARLQGLSPRPVILDTFWGGVLIGISLGILWTPCVGPILASVISLALTGTVTIQSFLITLSYSLGTAIPMFFIIFAGQRALVANRWLVRKTPLIQRGFGLIMILTAIAILFNLDRAFQAAVLQLLPKYGAGLTSFEERVFKVAPQNDKQMGYAPELILGGRWFNSSPLSLASLRGKVVLLDFWTYTCINCQRTLPYLRAWWDKYKDKGLVIIGAHAPEFEFEKSDTNLSQAIKDFSLTYPIFQDNNFDTWRAYDNHYWPAKYLIDKTGKIRYTHFGEGAYDETEMQIQTLLKEAGSDVANISVRNPTYTVRARTPETYLGSARSIPGGVTLVGNWDIEPEYASPKNGARLRINFDAQAVYLVMRPKSKPAKVIVRLDGVEVSQVVVDGDRLYTLVQLKEPGSHALELEFSDDQPLLFAFTFG